MEKSVVLPCHSSQARVEMNTVGCLFISLKNLYLKCDIRMTFSCQNISCGAAKIQKFPCIFVHVLCTYANIILLPFALCHISVGVPNYFNSRYYTHAFYACACLCFCSALHHYSKIDFLGLSHHTARAGSRKCLFHGAA